MNVKIVTLNNGAVFLCEVISHDNEKLTYKNGLSMMQLENGLQFVPVDLVEGKEVSVYNHALVHIPYTPVEKLVNYYKKQMGGIVEVENKIII